MIKAFKKLFSVDESNLGVDEIEEVEYNGNLYQDELAKFENETSTKLDFTNKNSDVLDYKIRDIENEMLLSNTKKLGVFNEISNQSSVLLDESVSNVEESSIRRSFDFERAIEKSFETNSDKKEEQVNNDKKKSEPEKPVVIKKSTADIISKENYVLKDIISPMRGVVRKETNSIKKDEEHKKAQIIKLRQQIKTKEIESDDYSEILEFPFETGDTKELEAAFSKLKKDEVKDTLSETSRFTLIEDSTGEMRLVIDEDE